MHTHLPRALFWFCGLLLAVANSTAQEQSVRPGINQPYENVELQKWIERFEGADRDVFKKRDRILEACQLQPGMTVADIGAGSGLFTRIMAAKVGPRGKVFAVDINKRFIDHILESCQKLKLDNVTGIVCPPDATGLAPRSVDVAFVCDTYHHFEFPHRTLASIYQALRPGGRLVLVEFEKKGGMKDHVRADQESVTTEIRASGFTLVDEVKDVAPNQYMLRFEKRVRPPAVPLVVHDPYFSVWSCADRLTDDWPRHWTGAIHALASMVRVDGRAFRLMGVEPKAQPAMRQVGLEVLPTRTIYDFEDAGVHVRLTFMSPVLPRDLELVGRPVTYLTWEVRSTDGHEHEVSIYYDNSAELVVDKATQPVRWSRPKIEGLHVLQIGSEEQPVLEKAGDNLRIDWGHLYVATAGEGVSMAAADHEAAREGFAQSGKLPERDDADMPRPAMKNWPVTACTMNLGKVGGKPASRFLMLAYDDLYSIEYLGTKLRPYWRRNGAEAADLLRDAAKQYDQLVKDCEAFDKQLMADLVHVGGPGYANLCALSYRQAIGAHKLVVTPDGRPMLFSKENFSNGCTATVDVMYPASPIFALLNNELLKATTTPVFDYAISGRWKFPFAPHDVGTYPKANGQVYGGGERTEENQMPVEESGNMLILAALISHLDGNTKYVGKYWPQLSEWAKYLKQKGLDPANQLCTDDFAGHLAHNANLSLKAIVALAAYARLCEMEGKAAEAKEYRDTAEEFVKQWVKLADDGDHFRLAFDKPGTWSQKYNLVWDNLLGLKLFPPEIARKEIAFYKTKLDRFGLPLDSREKYTKTDWEVWTATLAESRFDFDALMAPLYDFVNHTQPRVPLTDWYMTHDGKMRGFQARPVIGGVFIKMMADPETWKKWSSRAKMKSVK